MKFSATLLVAISMLGAGASAAGAADSLIWANYNGGATMSAANLDGTGSGRDLFSFGEPRGGSVLAPAGIALDPAAGNMYWANSTGPSITRGSISSCDPSATCAADLYPLFSGGPKVEGPGGPALDVAHHLMYWMNVSGELIRASLDGSGAVNDTIDTTGATAVGSGGVGGLAIDPRTNRIYWTNDDFGAGTISWADLGGDGGGDVNTTGANMGRPWGLSIDTAANRVYWTSFGGADSNKGSISWANLDGTGGGDLYTAANCPTLNGPNGLAIDRAANKIYWANFAGNSVSSANLDGTGGCGDLSSTGATMNGPDEVAVLKAPVPSAAATTTRVSKTANLLTCSEPSWGGDSPEANFYRSPRSQSFQWKKGDAVIAGRTVGTYVPTSSGTYSCAPVATNDSGTTIAPTKSLAFKRGIRFPVPSFKRRIKGSKLSLSGRIRPVITPAVSKKDCSGTLALKFVYRKKTFARKHFKLTYKNRKCAAPVALKVARKYHGKSVRLTMSISRSSKLTARPKTVSKKL